MISPLDFGFLRISMQRYGKKQIKLNGEIPILSGDLLA